MLNSCKASVEYSYTAQIAAQAAAFARIPSAKEAHMIKLRTMKKKMPYYHTSQEIREKAKDLSKNCEGANLKLETVSKDGVDIDVVNVTGKGKSQVVNNKVFIISGEHCRELIGPESGLRLLELFCDPAADGDNGRWVSNALEGSEFQLVLNANPRMRTKVEDGEFCLRSNPNGVDLNRNWGKAWSPDGGFEVWGGPHAFSEPETRIVKALLEKYRPTTFLQVHAGIKLMALPWGYKEEVPKGRNGDRMLSILSHLDERWNIPYGSPAELMYTADGTSSDWVYSEMRREDSKMHQKTPYAFLFEIYGGETNEAWVKEQWEEQTTKGLNMLQSGGYLGDGHFDELSPTLMNSSLLQQRRQQKACDSGSVSRRRRAVDMCSCRRRSSKGPNGNCVKNIVQATTDPDPSYKKASAPCKGANNNIANLWNDGSTFRCGGSWCLPMEGRCNGVKNCGDGTDEENCGPKEDDNSDKPSTLWCPRPAGWCSDSGSHYYDIDCDGDLIPDHYCDNGTSTGFIASVAGCTEITGHCFLNPNKCFSYFNPVTERSYDETVQNWAVTYLDMAAKISTDIKAEAAGKAKVAKAKDKATKYKELKAKLKAKRKERRRLRKDLRNQNKAWERKA